MSAFTAVSRLKDQMALYWMARTEQERKFLGIGGALAALLLVYALFLAPALEGSARLRAELPQLKQQKAQLEALAKTAAELSGQTPPQVTPMSRETLSASLTARGIKPESLSMTGEYAKLQVSGVAFSNLFAWLEAQRLENRISVLEAAITASTPAGQVDATVTLRQNTDASSR
ncbi:general secretion pathway protein GspM [Massilia violaceinigra]|uniref:General secretion pathway protein GspM n=1 Tax=Massilia violaceinigra TaxID=2045208 RepID=A0A2D2DFA5_9BURK|nr:type II secretion system protein GspM [Massilia violaceinigra]ATQ73656.1 general secretion pathway protein GspM [Massilia violaceinigra]